MSSPFSAAQPSDSGWSVPETDKFPINTVPVKKKKNQPTILLSLPPPVKTHLEYLEILIQGTVSCNLMFMDVIKDFQNEDVCFYNPRVQ